MTLQRHLIASVAVPGPDTPISPPAPDAAMVTSQAMRAVQGSMLRLRGKVPFFGTLALYAKFVPTDKVPTAATDGADVYVNPAYIASLAQAQLDGLLVHEVLHAALDHVHRRGHRESQLWNQAADIVVNGLVLGSGLELPAGGLVESALERFSVEEVFAVISRDGKERTRVAEDLLDAPAGDEQAAGQSDATDGASQSTRKAKAQRQWAEAVDRAAQVARGRAAGELPGGLERAFGLTSRPQLDWRAILWRFLARAPTDFAAFDRRFMHAGLYLETLEATGLRIVVGVDTSGSIDEAALDEFATELGGILRAYPATRAWLYYVDTEAYGPFPLSAGDPLPTPQGGGGTDFSPFFAAVETEGLADESTVAVYLTDGEGPFPTVAPNYPVLWVVTPGGADDGKFPFGEVVRMV